MAEEFFGSAAFSKTEVDVKQPPAVRGSMSMKAIRKQANKEFKAHKLKMKEGRARIKALNGQIRMHRFGAGLARVNAQASRAERRDIRKRMKHQREVHRQFGNYQKHQIRLNKYRAKDMRARARASKKAIREMKRKQNPRVHARSKLKAHKAGGKAFNIAWAMRLLKKAFAKKKSDARNHGASGVVRGSRGRTGFAGRRAGR